jgi:hypothetical protein
MPSVKIERVEGTRGRHGYYLRLEYTLLKEGGGHRKALRQATTLVNGRLVSAEDPLLLGIEDDPVRAVENYIDHLDAKER